MNFSLSAPLDPMEYENIHDLFEASYTIFQLEINYRATRPTIKNRFMYIDGTPSSYGKVKSFWHIASIGAEEAKYDMYPCCNHSASCKCLYMCDVDHPENFLSEENSIPCLYRASSIKWLKQIIVLANINPNHPNLQIWEHKKRPGEKHLKIRYIDGPVDYIIIFKVQYKNNDIDCYRLVTAFPVVLRSYKKRYNTEYAQYRLK